MASLVAAQRPVEMMVLVNAMVPAPGETGGDWWTNTDHRAARSAEAERHGDDVTDVLQAFFHDVPPEVRDDVMARGEPNQSGEVFAGPWPLDDWPDTPTKVIAGRDDRFFPVEFQRRIAKQRLGIAPDEMPGGYLLPLSQPEGLASRLHAYWAQNRSGA